MIASILIDYLKIFKINLSFLLCSESKDLYINKIKHFSKNKKWLEEVSLIFSKIPFNFLKKKNLSVLDLGCNAGYGTELISHKYSIKIKGIDVNKEYINHANKILVESKNDYRDYDGSKIPFQSNSFDIVYSFHVIGHVQNIDIFFQEIYRVLKPGGYLLIITPNARYKFFAFIDSIINNYKPDQSVLRYWFMNELVNKIKEKNFLCEKSLYYGEIPKIIKFLNISSNNLKDRILLVSRKL